MTGNEVDDDGNGATGDDDKSKCEGATGNEVDDNGNGATGDDDDDNDNDDGATGYDDEDDGDRRQRATKLMMIVTA